MTSVRNPHPQFSLSTLPDFVQKCPPVAPALGMFPISLKIRLFSNPSGHLFLVFEGPSAIYHCFFYSLVNVWVRKKYKCSLNHDWRAPNDRAAEEKVC